MRTSLLLSASILALTACSSSHRGDRGPAPDLGVTEAGVDTGTHDMSADLPVSLHCVSDSTCDDHLFCTGVELCQPGNPAADVNGCVRGPSACEAGFDCSETTHGCTVIPDGGPPGDVRSTIFYVDPDTMVRMSLPVPTTSSGGVPDTSCFGTARRPPTTGAATTLSFTVIDFQNLWPAASVGVDWFSDDVLPAGLACGAGCTATTASTSGSVSVSAVPGAWISYASHTHAGVDMAHSYVPTIAAHRAATSGSEHYVVSQQTLSLVPTLLGLHRVTGTSILLGGITDCAGEPVGGLVVRVFRTDGTLVVEPADGTPGSASLPAYRYFGDTGLPSSSQYFTNPNNGLYAGVNLPPSAPIRIEAWEDDGVTARLWACEEILTSADAVSFLDMGPYRSDGPSGCTETRP